MEYVGSTLQYLRKRKECGFVGAIVPEAHEVQEGIASCTGWTFRRAVRKDVAEVVYEK